MRKLLLLCCIAILINCNLQAQTQPAPEYFKNLFLKNANSIGIKNADLSNWRIGDAHYDKSNGITFMHLQQTYLGIDIDNAVNNVSFKSEKFVVGNFLPLQIQASTTKKSTPSISAKTALQAAALSINAKLSGFAIPLKNDAETHTYTFDKLGISFNEIPVKLVWIADEKNNLQLAWQVTISSPENNALWQIAVDALTGKVLSKNNLTVYEHTVDLPQKPHEIFIIAQDEASSFSPKNIKEINSAKYNVIAYPNESPLYADPSLQTNPWTINQNQNANTLNWNSDTITDYKVLRGNNIYTLQHLDSSLTNFSGYSPQSTTSAPDLTFNFSFDSNVDPTDDPSFEETNLFYWDNLMHDMSYQYGFDEAAGNFQESNFGRGGKSKDFVYALDQFGDGKGTNIDNSSFATPADGSNPSQHMFLWNESFLKWIFGNSPANFIGPKPATQSSVSNFNKIATKGPVTANVVVWQDEAHPDSSTGCTTPANPAAISGKIAYVDRGSCSFTVKFHNAQNAGAKAIIVGNVAPNDPRYDGTNTGDVLFTMSSDPLDNTITIPGFFIQYDTAVKIKKLGNVNVTLQNSPAIDASLDNTVSTHEYTHGISNRLVGGPQNVGCLSVIVHEQMGEGWSDWYALMMTENWSKAAITGNHIRSIGTYAFGLDTNYIGGLRVYPTSTNFAYDPWTYDSLAKIPIETSITPKRPDEHTVGEIWTSMLWDMTWDLIKDYGISQNIFDATGKGGNIIALKLVTTGLKLTKCSPGFVDGRNAILQADTLLFSGKYSKEIWTAFAKRGLGYSAKEGSAIDTKDGTPAYDLPSNILPVTITDFTAQKQGTTALLKWTTAQESNTNNFVVERSTDATNYKEVGEVKATGNSTSEKAYQLTDMHPVNGNNFYRLKEYDKDGRFNISDVRSLNFASLQPYIAIGPNPTKNTVTINIPGNTDNVTIRLISNAGQAITSKIMDGETLSLNVANLASGVYNIIVEGKDYTAKYKLIIQ